MLSEPDLEPPPLGRQITGVVRLFGILGGSTVLATLLICGLAHDACLDGLLSGKTVVSIKAGYAFNLALCSDGTLASWGDNGSGQLGDTDFTLDDKAAQVCPVGVILKKRRGFAVPIGERNYDKAPIADTVTEGK